ncbi:MAG TPA: cytochrome P460 family protein [Bryobacteraceae bacterium]|nr:cytochrome P460 family protein [Bryobacteraceae bacterium]
MKTLALFLVVGSVCLAASDKAAFTRDGELEYPSDYRQWTFLSSGLGMTYGPNAPAAGTPLRFDNVFVNPSSYREFMKTGTWPDGTVMILEVRESQTKGSINQHGSFQTRVIGIEAHVKDSRRFKGDWAFFNIGLKKTPSKVMAPGNNCQTCHEAHGSVDTTFVQFYPDLIPVAEKFGRMKRTAAAQ